MLRGFSRALPAPSMTRNARNGEYGESTKFSLHLPCSPYSPFSSKSPLITGPCKHLIEFSLNLWQVFETIAIFPIFVKIATSQGASLNISLEFLHNLQRIFAVFVKIATFQGVPSDVFEFLSNLWRIFAQIFHFRCCAHFWIYDFTFDEGLHSWAKKKYSCFAL